MKMLEQSMTIMSERKAAVRCGLAMMAFCFIGMAKAVEWNMTVEKNGVEQIVREGANPFSIDVTLVEINGVWCGRIVNHEAAVQVLGFEVWDDVQKVEDGKSMLYLPGPLGRRISRWPAPGMVFTRASEWTNRLDGTYGFVPNRVLYPSKIAPFQFMTLNNGSRGRLVMSEDPTAGAKELLCSYDPSRKTIRLGWRFPMFLATNDTYDIPRLVMRNYEGTWHVAAQAYRNWWNTCRHFVNIPESVRDMVGFMMVIVKQQNDEVVLPYTDFASFADTVLAYGFRHIEFHGWGIGGHDKFYPEYDPDPSMGGKEGLMCGIRALQAKGLHVSMYANGQLAHRNTTKWWREVGYTCPVMNRDGSSAQEYWVKFKDYPGSSFDICCPSCPAWRRRMLEICRAAHDLGADGFFYDQIGNQWPGLCFDGRHGHRVGANVYTRDRETMLSDILAEMRKIKPDFVLWSEQYNDSILGSVALCQSLQYMSDRGNNTLGRFGDNAQRFDIYPELSFYLFPELRMCDRNCTAACTRLRANQAAVCNLLVDFEVRYVPDRLYIEKGIAPDSHSYDNMAHRPNEPQVMTVENWKRDRDYLRTVSDFRRANRDLLLRGTFKADENFTVTCGTKTIANRWVAADGGNGILVWNADATEHEVTVKFDGRLVSTSEPELGEVDPTKPLAANSIRLYRYEKCDH